VDRDTARAVEQLGRDLGRHFEALTKAVVASSMPASRAPVESTTSAQVSLRPARDGYGLDVLLAMGGRWVTAGGSSAEGFVMSSHELPTALVTVGEGIAAELADACLALAEVLGTVGVDGDHGFKPLEPGPLLALASTRQLLAEVRARGEAELSYREEGDMLAIGAANLLGELPGSMLDYRPVDSS
jgi:hypothetical protein